MHMVRALWIGMLMLGALVATLLTTPVAAQRLPATRSAIPDTANAVPAYPEMLREAGVGGVVRVTFAVDSTGRPAMTSYVVRASAHDLLSAAVTNAIQRWRFTPARRASRYVADSVEQLVEFVPPSTEALLYVAPIALSRETLGPGRWRLAVGGPLRMPSTGPVAESLHVAIAAAAMDTILASLPLDPAYPTRIACLALGMTGPPVQPPLTLLRALSRPTYTVVAAKRCPRTFGSPVRVMSADGRPPEPDPPGEDPWVFTPLVPQSVDEATVLIDVAMSHATTSGTYRCVAQRDTTRAGGWRARCRSGRMAMH